MLNEPYVDPVAPCPSAGVGNKPEASLDSKARDWGEGMKMAAVMVSGLEKNGDPRRRLSGSLQLLHGVRRQGWRARFVQLRGFVFGRMFFGCLLLRYMFFGCMGWLFGNSRGGRGGRICWIRVSSQGGQAECPHHRGSNQGSHQFFHHILQGNQIKGYAIADCKCMRGLCNAILT